MPARSTTSAIAIIMGEVWIWITILRKIFSASRQIMALRLVPTGLLSAIRTETVSRSVKLRRCIIINWQQIEAVRRRLYQLDMRMLR